MQPDGHTMPRQPILQRAKDVSLAAVKTKTICHWVNAWHGATQRKRKLMVETMHSRDASNKTFLHQCITSISSAAFRLYAAVVIARCAGTQSIGILCLFSLNASVTYVVSSMHSNRSVQSHRQWQTATILKNSPAMPVTPHALSQRIQTIAKFQRSLLQHQI